MTAARGRLVALLLVTTSCVTPAGPAATTATIDSPEARAVRIDTTGCGSASQRTGSGIVVDDGLVLTVAHVVARSDGLEASIAGAAPVAGEVTALDLQRDLALVMIPSVHSQPIETARIAEGETGRIVGGATSGTLAFETRTVMGITTEEILGSEMHRRLGYELAAAATTGDSGAGAYDENGRLVGILFATHETEPTSWVTAAEEIDDFLSIHRDSTEPLRCDPEESQLG